MSPAGGFAATPTVYPPLIAVITKTSAPGAIRVSKAARSPSMKTLMWRRSCGVESHSRSRIPGQRRFNASITSATVAAATT